MRKNRELNRNRNQSRAGGMKKKRIILKVLVAIFLFMAIFTFGMMFGYIAGVKMAAMYYVQGLTTVFKYADVKIVANFSINQTKLTEDILTRAGYGQSSISEGVRIEGGSDYIDNNNNYKIPCVDSSINTCVPRGESLSSNSPTEQGKMQRTIQQLRKQVNMTIIP